MPITISGSTGIAGVDGSASTPAIQGTDTNTGIYSPGANRLGFATDGTQRGEFDASGNFQFNSGYGSVATAYGCRAWVNFNGTGTIAIRASGNVTSITDNGVGNYQVNFTNSMPDTNYAISVFYSNEAFASIAYPTFGGPSGVSPAGATRATYQQTGSFRIFFTDPTSYVNAIDKETVVAAVFR